MKTVGLLLLLTGMGAAMWLRSDDVVVSYGDLNLLVVTWHKAPGVVCADGSNGDNIAKVACGKSGTSSTVDRTSVRFPEGTEFAFSGTCKGTESNLGECSFDVGSIKCDSLVTVSCDQRRSYVL